ncbi:uncharacterized protein LOC116921904 isoform X1 [Daphnia magna]|uniref:uncharacterized protein LOC116921904 isoform X1 n=1 Tax=Daphnia magna TaxID=35525 RepID=UPI001E1BAEDF|nr:uncharacterized protein LOC116921904 isoform X1 [Daphnia magna]XP_045028438.1 uncharacterized protein LOC116921904 isoform X1 [Daphnia magna]XP_045028439.1 uncharacterized protein LOC116921904 isoform X1 [Daphnia magna]
MMDFEKMESSRNCVVMDDGPVDGTPDSPIDLSQLSTRCRSVDLTNRSVSESCLAPAAAVAAKKRRIHGFKDPLPPPALAEHSAADSLKYRSMSHADIAGYRTPWLSGDLPESKPANLSAPAEKSTATSSASAAETLKFRCMSESRLAGSGNTTFHPATHSGNSSSSRKHFTSNSDLLRTATDNSQLEFLLRRTASESVLPSSRSGEPAGSAAMEMLMRQQQMIQHHYQQLLVQQQQDGSEAGSSSSSSSSSYLSSASPWLLGLFGYGYTQMLQSFQAAQQQQIATDPATGSGQISGGPSSPAVAASISGSDGEGEMEEEDMDAGGFSHGKKRSPRALTGKHVKLGTGASPTTLNTLRLKIQERQRMKLVKKSIPSGSAFASAAAAKKNGTKLKSRAK